jgi:hypothetical protein
LSYGVAQVAQLDKNSESIISWLCYDGQVPAIECLLSEKELMLKAYETIMTLTHVVNKELRISRKEDKKTT